MAVIKWYKRDANAALAGMMVLTLEERGAYNTVLDLIYSHDNNLIDDDRFIAGWLRCDLRIWKRIKNRLIELGKLEARDGLLTNFRATSEIDEALTRGASVADVSRIKGIKSGIVRRNNKELAEPTVEPKTNTPTPTTTTRVEESTIVLSSAREVATIPKPQSLAKSETPEFSEFWTAYPKRDGANPRSTAIKAFLAARARAPPAEIIGGAQRFAQAMAERGETGGRFIPMAATWLNQDRWSESYGPPAPKPNGIIANCNTLDAMVDAHIRREAEDRDAINAFHIAPLPRLRQIDG